MNRNEPELQNHTPLRCLKPPPTPPLPNELPVVPLRGAVVLPMTVAPLGVSRPLSVEAVNKALAGDRMVLLLLQKNDNDDPSPDDLQRIGTVAIIRQMAKGQGGMRVLVEGVARARAEFLQTEKGFLTALIKPLPESSERSLEIDAHVRRLQDLVDRALSLATGLSPDIRALVASLDDPLRVAYLLASLLDMKAEDKQRLLEEDSISIKLDAVATALSREIDVLELKGKIESRAETGDDRRAAAVRAAPADEGDPVRARRGRTARSRSCASGSPRPICPSTSPPSPIARSIASSG